MKQNDILKKFKALLVSCVTESDEEACWTTLSLKGRDVVYSQTESVYDGVSGILIFLTRYKNLSDDEEISKLLLKICRWLIKDSKHKQTKLSFFTGYLGVLYSIALANSELNNEDFKNHIESETYNLRNRRASKNLDFLNGTAGEIFGAFKMLEIATTDISQDNLIDFIVDSLPTLFSEIYLGPDGLFINKQHYISKPICGLAHGNSGNILLFAILLDLTGSKILEDLIVQLLIYEDAMFLKDIGNWPDNRVNVHGGSFLESSNRNESTINNFAAWCSGSPGILFVRGFLYQLKSKKIKRHLEKQSVIYEKAASEAFVYTEKLTANLGLCHGYFGNILCLLYYAKATKNEGLITKLNSSFKKVSNSTFLNDTIKTFPNSTSSDLGLFKGITGWGYFFLDLNLGFDFSIICPNIPIVTEEAKKSLKKKLVDIDSLIYIGFLKTNFQNSVSVINLDLTTEHLINCGANFTESISLIKVIIAKTGRNALYKIDKCFIGMEMNVVNYFDLRKSYALTKQQQVLEIGFLTVTPGIGYFKERFENTWKCYILKFDGDKRSVYNVPHILYLFLKRIHKKPILLKEIPEFISQSVLNNLLLANILKLNLKTP